MNEPKKTNFHARWPNGVSPESEPPYFVVLAPLDKHGALTSEPSEIVESVWQVWDGMCDRISSWETMEEAIAERERLHKLATERRRDTEAALDPDYMTAEEAELYRQAESLPVYDGPANPVPFRKR